MPANLDIDRTTNLNASMAPYQEHLIIASGQSDWKSKIEDEKAASPWGDLVANVKSALSPKGQFHNPYHNVVVSTSSFETPRDTWDSGTSRALLFPSFRLVENISSSSHDVTDFIRTFLLPETLHPAFQQQSKEEHASKIRDSANASSSRWASNIRQISSPTILICSHNSRDSRCGILGPLLHSEFTRYINKRHTLRRKAVDDDLIENTHAKSETFSSHPEFHADLIDRKHSFTQPINIGMISHIGGHKFAGNVILYIPPDYQCQPVERVLQGPNPQDREFQPQQETSSTISSSLQPSSSSSLPGNDFLDSSSSSRYLSPLAGKGIWYGRVEPKHVEGIVEQTINHGRIIKELFRGGINADGSQIRLPLD